MRPARDPPVVSLSAAAVGLDSVTKIYGSGDRAVTALDRVTIIFTSQAFTAVMGPSGSGKSTLLLNTALMATAGRQPELALIRLIGATRRQARRMIAWEALVTTVAGLAVGALIARIAVQAPRGQPGWHIAVPAVVSGAILAGAAVLGLAGALAPARLALRARPTAPFGQGE